MIKLLLIAIGGATGALSRYGVGRAMTRFGVEFPWGTLCVNLVGSFLIGLLAGVQLGMSDSPRIRLLMALGITGFLGAFTTFSAFSLESVSLIRNDKFVLAGANVLANCMFGLLLAFAGFWASRYLVGVLK
ncbi:MAG: fluoride efflux transporter CrcB [Phycisphaerae bacterium]|jgi:CrcB protein|nr:fluoride efflux transporter CrcB [Phycisphaerae bacterium]MDP7286418.1 fluoride efflux transporter CrcB [Phycisphaerae bacterium]